MKKLRYILILAIGMTLSLQGFGQSVGELNRFNNESLSSANIVKLYPNPSVDYLEVKIDNFTLTDASFTVHNIIGNIIEVPVERVAENEFRLKVENLAPGYYLLAIKDNQNVFKETYKFLKR